MTHGTVHGTVLDFKKLPKQISRAGSIEALYTAWRKMQKSICTPKLLHGMPRAIAYVAERIYEVDPHMAADAIRQGDPALFVGVLVRLAQIDASLIAAGRTIADRAPVVYAKHLVEGFRTVAEEAYVEMGGAPLGSP